VKRSTGLALAAVASLAALALVLLASGVGKHIAKRALARWNGRNRFAMRVVERPFAHLAASQVGYAPSMPKQFTSAHAFKRFQVRGERDGAVVFDGGAPVRTVKTDLLGSIDTVWIGDFSNLTTPGRYRIEADGSDGSLPFEIGPDVFGRPLRAVQRW